jgi:RHS repeat-associated protein
MVVIAKEFDVVSGPLRVQHLRARYYDPTVGQFTSMDPFAGDTSDPQSLHKYAYVHGDPVNGIDPSGMFLQTIFAGFVSAFVDFGAGLFSIGQSIYYGIGGFFNMGMAAQAALIHHKRVEIDEFATWIISDPETRVGEVISEATKDVVKNLPPGMTDRVKRYLIIRGAGRLVGNGAVNLSLQQAIKLAAQNLLAKTAVQSATRGQLIAGSLALGGAILAIQIQGISHMLAAEEEAFRAKWPAEWRRMHAFHNSSYIYGVAPDEFDDLFTAMDTIRKIRQMGGALNNFLKNQGF